MKKHYVSLYIYFLLRSLFVCLIVYIGHVSYAIEKHICLPNNVYINVILAIIRQS